MSIKYKDIILKKFSKFGFKPRNNQLELINQILAAYLDEGKKYVALSSPTGTGKSLIAVIVAECMRKLKHSEGYRGKKSSFILMDSNVLVQQYRKSFSKYDDFIQIMGASNYNCSALSTSADACINGELKREAKEAHCSRCEYMELARSKNNFEHLITNYAYFLTVKLYAPQVLNERLLTVCDEAHKINDVFCNLMELKISVGIIRKILAKMRENKWTQESYSTLMSCANQLENKQVNKSNYKIFLGSYYNAIKNVHGQYCNAAEEAVKMEDYASFIKFNSQLGYLSNTFQKYTDLNTYKYKHVIDIGDDFLKISPIFIDKMFPQIEHSKYFLFMSATIDKKFISTTLNLDKKLVKFIQSGPVFKKETKEVVFLNHTSYNYKTMKYPDILSEMNSIIREIVSKYKTTRGIILTPSYYINKCVSESLLSQRNMIKIFEHDQTTNLKVQLELYLAYKKGPCILISPSLFEGVDLPDKLSEWQVMVKAPYASLADKRIKYIFENYPDIYTTLALYKVVQGFGRSTRHENDHSITYCLDSNISRLFWNKTNYWKGEFKIS